MTQHHKFIQQERQNRSAVRSKNGQHEALQELENPTSVQSDAEKSEEKMTHRRQRDRA